MTMKTTINLFIYLLSYATLHFSLKRDFDFTSNYGDLVIYFFIAWIVSGVISGKLRRRKYPDFWAGAKPLLISFIFFITVLTVLINFFLEGSFSRIVVYGAAILALMCELIFMSIWEVRSLKTSSTLEIKISIINLVIEIILLNWIILFYVFPKIGYNTIGQEHILPILTMLLSWFIGAVFTHQFKIIDFSKTILRVYSKFFKSYGLMISLVISSILIIHSEVSGKEQFIIGSIIYAFWSTTILLIRFIYNKPLRTDEVRLKFMRATTYNEMEDIEKKLSGRVKYKVDEFEDPRNVLSDKLENVYLRSFPGVFDFISRSIDLRAIDYLKSVILRSADPYNVQTLPDEYLNLFLNLHQMNDIRRINAYYIDVNNKLKNGGLFVGTFQPIRFRYKKFLEEYPNLVAQVFYFTDFLWRRVTPKLPFLQKIYFVFTKGKNRALPLAEGLGRLYYCGFEVIDFTTLDNFVYFIAKKVSKPSSDPNPSYGPLFKMRRICKDGEIKGIYKFRTMHPYSEYLQKFIYEHKDLQEGGKINDDFRITNWGKVLRKLWLDEFPMFINFFKGDLKLFGVRPLSKHYFGLYPEDLQKRRIKYKPGLVPPFYVDLPKTLAEVIESERRYLGLYEKNPIRTDIIYFVKAWYNILVKKARSG